MAVVSRPESHPRLSQPLEAKTGSALPVRKYTIRCLSRIGGGEGKAVIACGACDGPQSAVRDGVEWRGGSGGGRGGVTGRGGVEMGWGGVWPDGVRRSGVEWRGVGYRNIWVSGM